MSLEERVVCRSAFGSLHGIKPGRVKHVAMLTAKGEIPIDGRGKHNNRPHAYDPGMLKQIHNHIASYPVRKAHYSSRDVYYLSGDLTISSMHRAFLKDKYPCCYEEIMKGTDRNKICCPPKYYVYQSYFQNNFGYKFGKPKSDICNTCMELANNINGGKNEKMKVYYTTQLKVHKERAKWFHKSLEKCKELAKENENVETISFDFMQHVPVPKIGVNEIFYLRQLWLYTFGIHQHSIEKPFFFCWSESDAGHGVNEVLSCLLQFIKNHVGPQVDTLYLFSDACTGQNRNSTMVYFLQVLSNSGQFKNIYHTFPTRGHSFLPCDADFSHLAKIKHSQESVFVPDQWVDLFREKYNITSFDSIQFYNFSAFLQQYFKKTATSCKEKFRVTKYKRFEYQKGSLTVRVSEVANANVWRKFCLLRNKLKLSDLKLPEEQIHLLPFGIPVKAEKMTDIRKLFKYMAPQHIAFYNNIQITGPNIVDNIVSESDISEGDE